MSSSGAADGENELIRPLGSLGRAVAGKPASEDQSPLAQGVRFIRDSLSRKMSEMGIEPVPLLGKKFDPNQGEAVDLIAVADPAQDGLVLDEVARGYTLSGKPLRPARV